MLTQDHSEASTDRAAGVPKLLFRMRSSDMLGLCLNSSRAATSAAVLCVLCNPCWPCVDALLDSVDPAELRIMCSSRRCSCRSGSPARSLAFHQGSNSLQPLSQQGLKAAGSCGYVGRYDISTSLKQVVTDLAHKALAGEDPGREHCGVTQHASQHGSFVGFEAMQPTDGPGTLPESKR